MTPSKDPVIPGISDEQRQSTLHVPLLALRDLVFFPHVTGPVMLGRASSLASAERAAAGDNLLFVTAQHDPNSEDFIRDDLYEVGCLVRIVQVVRVPDGTQQVMLKGLSRAVLVRLIQEEEKDGGAVLADIMTLPSQEEPGLEPEFEAAFRTVLASFQQLAELGAVPSDVLAKLTEENNPDVALDLVAFHTPGKTSEKQQVLELLVFPRRLERLVNLVEKQRLIAETMRRIQRQVRSEFDSHQREMFLREELHVIKNELGEGNGAAGDVDELRRRAQELPMPEEARQKALHEADRIEILPTMSPEYGIALTYIEWLTNMPWKVFTRDKLNLRQAARVLDHDHYGLRKAKDRVLDYLAVRKLNKHLKSPILCFVGPPGTGKTSLGRSIARAMGRKFVRVSLGGVRDEAEIRGHRRTYVGALPGKILQRLRDVGSANPVFMIDEIDKLGADWRGDPAAALLEVLDPEQNNSFRDHYLEVPFDLSRVMFIATANRLGTLPPALLDRMEVIEFEGYTEPEKVEIARHYLVPQQVKDNGLVKLKPSLRRDALHRLIRDYTREAGVRLLNQQIGTVCRKLARRIAADETPPKRITPTLVRQLLGPRQYQPTSQLRADETGVAVGLAWTEAGGDLLPIEVALVPGKGELKLTGNLGQVMKESAEAAVTFVKGLGGMVKPALAHLAKQDIHIHVPAGAVPKDGPSAGLTLAIALVSALTEQPPKAGIALTGELTLRGRILPVGGLKTKLLAAQREGIREVVLPKANRDNLAGLPEELRSSLELHLVGQATDAFKLMFGDSVSLD